MKGQLPSRFRALRRHDFTDAASRIGSNHPCRPAEVQIVLRPDVILFRPSTDLPAPHRSRSKKTEHARASVILPSPPLLPPGAPLMPGRSRDSLRTGRRGWHDGSSGHLSFQRAPRPVMHEGSPRLSTNVLIGRQ